MIFYGWIILIVCFINVCGEGAMKNLFPIILLPLLQTFSWSRAATSGIFSTAGLVSGLSSPAIGILLDKLGPRRFFPLGGVLLFLGLLAASRITHYWQLILIYACLLAIGENIISSYTNMAVLGRWFEKKRGRAIGIADVGTAVGAAVFVPVAQWLILHFDWRHTFQFFAFIFLIILVFPNWIFMRASPEEMGQLPDSRQNQKTPSGKRPQKGKHEPNTLSIPPLQEISFRKTLGVPSLYFLTLARLFGNAADYMITIHYIAFFIGAGYQEMLAASALAFTHLVSSLGRPLSGIVSDRIGREMTLTISYAFSITGIMFILGFGDGIALWPVVVFVVLRGLSIGPTGIAIGAKAADLFDGAILGRVMGIINMGRGLGLALGPFLGGLFYDITQNYVLAFSFAVGFSLLSLFFFWMAHLKGKALIQPQ